MKRALVTGATGFVGGHLVPLLVEGGWAVRAFARPTSQTAHLEALGVEVYRGSLTDDGDVLRALAGTEAVIHAAGGGLSLEEADIFAANTETTATLVRNAPASLARFVLVSSLAAHGPSSAGRPATERDADAPRSAYGRSKREAERHLDELSCRAVVVRPPALYGDGERRMDPLLAAARRGLVPTVHPRGEISLLSGRDCATAIVAALEGTHAHGVYYVAEPEPISRAAMARALGARVGKRVVVIPLPPPLVRAAAAFAEARARLLGAPLPISRDKVRDILQPHQACDPSRAREELGWSARDRFETWAAGHS